jgi:hypothetical protein
MVLKITPKTFPPKAKAKEIQGAMKLALIETMHLFKGKDLRFYLLPRLPVEGGQPIPLLVVTPKPAEWESVFKQQKIKPMIGTCTVTLSEDKKSIQISVKAVKNASTPATLLLINKALLKDPKFKAIDLTHAGSGGSDKATDMAENDASGSPVEREVRTVDVGARVGSALYGYLNSAAGKKAYGAALGEAMKEGRADGMNEADIADGFSHAVSKELASALSKQEGWETALAQR